ncbi:PP2C family protein-serine/threonine phosphatase [Desulfovermiculus halophilus]|uniref:PP2C family protein-serine/threonine phosphatase n=1 Tax=Desulfovermiculus halophilus TaxID=339722 RepID=UPI0006865BEC|nr:SpoIIE family protein phosphatase [Desulfovermiculus halophilus]
MVHDRTRILIVDDVPGVCDLLCEFLETDYRVQTAQDGNQALQAYTGFHPDIILLDMHMPGMGGLDVISALRGEMQDQEVYILVITGETSFELKRDSLEQGANDYLIRPYHSDELLARIRVAERQINLRKQLKTAYRNIEREIEMLGDIQSRLLPGTDAQFSNLLIDTLFKPSGRASGDFFDYFPVGEHIVRIAVCDVSGHGARAAFLMGVVRTLIRLSETTRLDLEQVVTLLNNSLMDIIGNECDFVSLFLADVDLEAETLSYVNAGHCPGLLADKSRNIHALDSTLPILGFVPVSPKATTCSLQAPGALFLYTDGIYEWQTPSGTYFDQDTFLQLAAGLLPAEGPFLSNLMQAMQGHTPGIPFRDDVTALHVRILPEASSPHSTAHGCGREPLTAAVED